MVRSVRKYEKKEEKMVKRVGKYERKKEKMVRMCENTRGRRRK